MIDKNQAIKNGITIIDSTKATNALFDILQAQFPQTIKDGQVSLNAIKMLLGLNESASNANGYELTFTGKGLANALYSTPCQKLLKLQESFTPQTSPNKHPKNAIIVGDNLDALKLLKAAYTEKIKMIYIDPPYNTTNENFIYPDNFRQDYKKILEEVGLIEIDENGQEVESEDLKFFKNIQGSRTHSGWLSFMLPRLKLARDLLKEDGVIFISIDDNEQANLKLLCDEIFGEDNFVTSVPRLTSSQRSGQEDYMNISHDYILIYSYATDFNNSTARKNLDKNKIEQDKNGHFIKGDTKAILASQTQGYSKGGDYDFEYNGKIYKPIDSKGKRNRWLWSLKRMQAAADLGILVETKTSLRMQIYLDKKFDEKTNTMIDKDENLIFHTADLMIDSKLTNATGTKELEKILNAKVFDNPKPTNLIKTLLQLSTTPNSNDIILDFFAGSGTTAQAVMELNAEDKGNREFILVQIDEEIKEDKSKSAYDFCKKELKSENPVISDITIERVKRAAQKIIQSSKDNDLNLGFKVYNLQDKAQITNTQNQTTLFNNSNLTPFDKALNLALQSGKTLSNALETIIQDKLYKCEDAYFCVDLGKDVLECLAKTKNEMIFLDGYEDIDLQAFLNLNASFNERVSVVY